MVFGVEVERVRVTVGHDALVRAMGNWFWNSLNRACIMNVVNGSIDIHGIRNEIK